MTTLAIFFASRFCARTLSPNDCFFAIFRCCQLVSSAKWADEETTWSLCEWCAYEGLNCTSSAPYGQAYCDGFSSSNSGRYLELLCNPGSPSYVHLFLWPWSVTCRSNVDSFRACIFQHGRNSFLVDRFDGFRRNLQRNPAIFFRNEEAFLLDINLETTLGLVVRVGNVVSCYRALARKFISSRHESGGLALVKRRVLLVEHRAPGIACAHNEHRTANIRQSMESLQGYPQPQMRSFLPIFGEGGQVQTNRDAK